MSFPDPKDTYEGPERETPLWTQFDTMIKAAHEDQPITVQELMELIQGMFYRLRWSLTFTELVVEIRELLRHNEFHITRDEWLLTGEDGELLPLVTPEMREINPEKAAIGDELLRTILEGGPHDAAELFNDS